MSSLKDVSALAGVNVSTVSRYLSGKLTVRKETEDRIKEAIRALDYRPNSVARALKLRGFEFGRRLCRELPVRRLEATLDGAFWNCFDCGNS